MIFYVNLSKSKKMKHFYDRTMDCCRIQTLISWNIYRQYSHVFKWIVCFDGLIWLIFHGFSLVMNSFILVNYQSEVTKNQLVEIDFMLFGTVFFFYHMSVIHNLYFWISSFCYILSLFNQVFKIIFKNDRSLCWNILNI